MSRVFGAPEQAKLKQLVKDGWQVMDEIKSLQEGLNETIISSGNRIAELDKY